MAGFLVISGLVLTAIFGFMFLNDWIENDFSGLKSIIGKIKNVATPYSFYEVSKAEYMPSIYGGYYRVIIKEDGVNIPIDCPNSVAKKLCDIMALNAKGSSVSVKAKIDHKNLRLVSLKGYMVKQ